MMPNAPSKSVILGMIVSALGFLWSPAPADADHILGLRISNTQVSDLEVAMDITGFYSESRTDITFPLGTFFYGIPALDWGDGSVYGPVFGLGLDSTTTVDGRPVRVYRSSVRHTYDSPGTYTITVNAGCPRRYGDCPTSNPITGDYLSSTFVTTTLGGGPTTVQARFLQASVFVALGDAPAIPVHSWFGGSVLVALLTLAGWVVLRRRG